MKKYVFAGDFTMGNMVGVHRYAHQMLLALDELLGTEGSQEFQDLKKANVELVVPKNSEFVSPYRHIRVVKKGNIRNKIEKYIWQQLTFPLYVRSQKSVGVDLALALPLWGCDICAIHDCIMEAFPEGFSDHQLFRKIYILKVKRCAALKKRRIVTVSQDAKKEIQKYYGIPDERITVTGNGWNHMKDVVSDENIFKRLPTVEKNNYFFSLGSKYKHKNFEWILKTAKKNPEYQFVISGDENYSGEAKKLKLHELKNVFFTGYLEDGELKALMVSSAGLIQPSFYEGFGIPPLEALSVGKKIIVSNVSCLPEIYEDTAYYIDPHSDGCDLDEILKREVASPEKVLEKYTWNRCARRLATCMVEK